MMIFKTSHEPRVSIVEKTPLPLKVVAKIGRGLDISNIFDLRCYRVSHGQRSIKGTKVSYADHKNGLVEITLQSGELELCIHVRFPVASSG